MGRRRKNQVLDEKVQRYLAEYELDDLNEANDMASLIEMCRLEITMEKIQDALDKIKDYVVDARKVKDLQSTYKDAVLSYTNLQSQLGINRNSRQSESDESPLQYIQRIQDLSKKFLDSRLKHVVCPSCKQILGKYFFYVNEKGEAGSIYTEKHPIEAYKYTVRIECWKCGKMVTVSNETLKEE